LSLGEAELEKVIKQFFNVEGIFSEESLLRKRAFQGNILNIPFLSEGGGYKTKKRNNIETRTNIFGS